MADRITPELREALLRYGKAERADRRNNALHALDTMANVSRGQSLEDARANARYQPFGAVAIPGKPGLTPQERAALGANIAKIAKDVQKNRLDAAQGGLAEQLKAQADNLKEYVALLGHGADLLGTASTANVAGQAKKLQRQVDLFRMLSAAELENYLRSNSPMSQGARDKIDRIMANFTPFLADVAANTDGPVVGDAARNAQKSLMSPERIHDLAGVMGNPLVPPTEKFWALQVIDAKFGTGLLDLALSDQDDPSLSPDLRGAITELQKNTHAAVETQQANLKQTQTTAAQIGRALQANRRSPTGAAGFSEARAIIDAATAAINGSMAGGDDGAAKSLADLAKEIKDAEPDPEALTRAQEDLANAPNAVAPTTLSLEQARAKIISSSKFREYAKAKGYEGREDLAFDFFVADVRKAQQQAERADKQARRQQLKQRRQGHEDLSEFAPQTTPAPPSDTASLEELRNNAIDNNFPDLDEDGEADKEDASGTF